MIFKINKVMAEVVDFIDKIKRYYPFTPAELKGFIISVLALAFIISFNDWGTTSFDAAVGAKNFLIAVLISGISLLVHHSGQRLWGLATGYRVEYQVWSVGILIGLIAAFIINGLFQKPGFWLLLPGGFAVQMLAGHRLGWFRYDINYWAVALTAFAGNIATLILIIFLKIVWTISPNSFLMKFIIFNVLLNIYTMLPIPPLNGSKIFFGGRWLYVFSFPFIVASSILLYASLPIWVSLGISFVIGFILWLAYYLMFEKDVWTP